MTLVKLTAIAAFTALPVVATIAETNTQGVPQHVELSVEERGHAIAELSPMERDHLIAELSQDDRNHVIAGYDPEERKNQIG
ncbi:MAG: hypothetical protein AAFQ05_04280 [Pseudomonadota bacterium]